jgi:hypothetical protein
LEQSRPLLDQSGVRIAAVSYDSRETLHLFADRYGIGFPLLSDANSAVIRSFGILNTNIAPGLRAHGVPHPVEYLVAPDGTVLHKYFVPNYQHRVTGAAIVLEEFGVVEANAPVVTLQSGALTVRIGLSSVRAFAGQEIGFFAKFALEPEWHVYDTTVVAFDDPKLVKQSFSLEQLSAYEGQFQGLGSVLLKFPLDAGPITLSGEVRFQQCSANICEPPETLPFELSLTLDPFMVATSGG